MSDIEKADEFHAFCHEVVTNKIALTELARLKSENAALKEELTRAKSSIEFKTAVIRESAEDAIRLRSELAKANVDQWIPVSARLPEKSGGYLIFPFRGDWARCFYDEDDKRFYIGGHAIGLFRETASHWRELPTPPKV